MVHFAISIFDKYFQCFAIKLIIDKAVNYFCKIPHLRCLTVFWIRLSNAITVLWRPMRSFINFSGTVKSREKVFWAKFLTVLELDTNRLIFVKNMKEKVLFLYQIGVTSWKAILHKQDLNQYALLIFSITYLKYVYHLMWSTNERIVRIIPLRRK